MASMSAKMENLYQFIYKYKYIYIYIRKIYTTIRTVSIHVLILWTHVKVYYIRMYVWDAAYIKVNTIPYHTPGHCVTFNLFAVYTGLHKHQIAYSHVCVCTWCLVWYINSHLISGVPLNFNLN